MDWEGDGAAAVGLGADDTRTFTDRMLEVLRKSPVLRLEGKKTTSALDQFIKDRRLPGDAANGANFFQAMLDAAKAADGVGFSWCNETPHAVMAALGVDENGAVTTRGWYRVDAGKCVKPDLPAKPARLYSFAEAVDGQGQALRRGRSRSKPSLSPKRTTSSQWRAQRSP